MRPVHFYSDIPACDNDTKQHLNNNDLLKIEVTVKPPGKFKSKPSRGGGAGKGMTGSGVQGTPEALTLLFMALPTAHVAACFLTTAGGCTWFTSTSLHHHEAGSSACLGLQLDRGERNSVLVLLFFNEKSPFNDIHTQTNCSIFQNLPGLTGCVFMEAEQGQEANNVQISC